MTGIGLVEDFEKSLVELVELVDELLVLFLEFGFQVLDLRH